MPQDLRVADWAIVCQRNREDPEFRGIRDGSTWPTPCYPPCTMTLRWGRVGLTAAGLSAALWIGSCTLNPQPEPPGDKTGSDNGPTSLGATGTGGSSTTGAVGGGGSPVITNPGSGGGAGAGPMAVTDGGRPNASDASVAAAVEAGLDASSVDASSVDASAVDAKGDAAASDATQDGSKDVAPDAVEGTGD